MWETAERSEEFSKPCENPRGEGPEQICKALSGFAQGGSFHSLFLLVLGSRQTLSHGTSCKFQAVGVVDEPV